MSRVRIPAIVLAALFAALPARSETPLDDLAPRVEGKLFEPGSQRRTLLFRWKLWASADWHVRRGIFFTPSGEMATSEELEMEDRRFRRYTLVHHLARERGSIERVGGRLHFSYTRGGTTRTNEEDFVPNFVAGPLLVPYLQRHWDAILRGDEVRIRLGVPDRRETVGFEIFLREQKRVNGRERLVLKMKPSSFVIAALVDPVYLTFSADGRTLHEVVGRTIPLRQVGRGWKPVDAEAVYWSVDQGKDTRAEGSAPPDARRNGGLEGPERERATVGGGP